MIEPVIFKKSAPIALLTILRAVLPAVLAVGCLYASTAVFEVEFDEYFVAMTVLIVVPCCFLIPPLSDNKSGLLSRRLRLAMNIFMRWMVLLATLLAIGYLIKFSPEYSRRVIGTWALVTPLLIIATAMILYELHWRILASTSSFRRAVFAGYNESSLGLADRLSAHSEMCISVTGFFDDRSVERLGVRAQDRLLGKLPELAKFVNAQPIDIIFIALPVRHIQRVVDLLDALKDTTASIYYVPDIFVFDLIQARSGEIMGIPVIAMCETPFYGARGVFKRLADIVTASGLLLLASPLMLAIALAIKASSRGPAIFRQRRYGLDGQQIVVYKFRTMTVMEDGAEILQATRGDSRITSIGRYLRRYSLDELPQLINVLQGRMSLVGPRPHAVAHNEMYRKLVKGYMVRHKVLPGITGLAQVNGLRGETGSVAQMEARVRYDLEYLRNWSPALDLKIIWKTVWLLLVDRNAY